ncbi:MAG TPA: Rne/Rng family ribonuclease [Acetobacteraceae bacterium]|nr:Rne/Rng family ribonuclease [Acetobacteraceae bacterium]
MTKRMLIDSTHAEETRVVVLDGSRLEDFDVETSTKRQLKGNIYLAKVVRVEPSLQAAFVEYGGNRHGFLAFSEIHPDYYQIPVADRQRLIEQEAEEARREEEEEDRAAEAAARDGSAQLVEPAPMAEPTSPTEEPATDGSDVVDETTAAQPAAIISEVIYEPAHAAIEADATEEKGTEWAEWDAPVGAAEPAVQVLDAELPVLSENSGDSEGESTAVEAGKAPTVADDGEVIFPQDVIPEPLPPETVGGDTAEETRERRMPPRFLRNYKIQEVIKRRQILLVQVVKEERGTKGAALTTYLSLAGRFSVLMPNSPRGGGISRKITSAADRRRLKEIMAELDIPQGMGLIVRTAGANRPKPEIKRDCEYLLRLWDDIREHTLRSVAPALIYEEASLIKRAIRDVYSRDIDEIQVDGEDGWRAAHEFMRMLMPSHAKKVQLWKNGGLPLFAKYQVEAQLDSMLLPTVQLRSGGYLVINQAEALVAIDVNSGRSTRERGIEETALRTNLEAADEVARQLRLRDLAGLIVIDFIDMETKKHNSMVERRLKEALKNDRARIQVGHISHFGLMEMSRQRLRPSLAETSFIACPHCAGTGHVRSTESAAIHVLRGIEEEGAKRRAAEIVVYTAPQVALYILNHKRERLGDIESRYGMRVMCLGDDGQMSSQFRIERVRAQVVSEAPVAITQEVTMPPPEIEGGEDVAVVAEETEATADELIPTAGDEAQEDPEHHRRHRRRRRGGRRGDGTAPAADEAPSTPADEAVPAEMHVEGVPEHTDGPTEDDGRARRRGRRGGRRRRHDGKGEIPAHAEPGADQPDLPPVYAGPTPANPFGGNAFDIFDILEQAEAAPPPRTAEHPKPEAEAPVIADAPEPALTEMRRDHPTEELEEPTAAMVEPAIAEAADVEPRHEPPVFAAVAQTDAESTVAVPEPEPMIAANDAAPEPAIKPIIIGGEQDVMNQKKRGWWRR